MGGGEQRQGVRFEACRILFLRDDQAETKWASGLGESQACD